VSLGGQVKSLLGARCGGDRGGNRRADLRIPSSREGRNFVVKSRKVGLHFVRYRSLGHARRRWPLHHLVVGIFVLDAVDARRAAASGTGGCLTHSYPALVGLSVLASPA